MIKQITRIEVPRFLQVLLQALAVLAIGYAVARLGLIVGGFRALILLVGTIVVLGAFIEPRLPLLFIVPAIALSPEFSIAGLPLRIGDLILLPLAMAWVLRLTVGRTVFPQTPLTRPILVLLGMELISTLLGALGGTTTLGVTTYSGTFFWLKGVEVFLLFFIVVDTLRRKSDIRLWAYLFALSGAVLALNGMIQHLSVGDFNQFISDPEGGATYSLLALALISAISLTLALLLRSPHYWRRLLLAATLLPFSYTFTFTFSRQAYIGMGAALLCLTYTQRRKMAPFILMIIIIAIYLSPESVADRAGTIFDPVRLADQGSLISAESIQASPYGIRIRAWQKHLPTVLKTNPFFGLGSSALPPGFLDSQYLVTIYYHGLIGLGLFLWLLRRTGQLGWQLSQRQDADPELRAIGLASAAATLGLTVAALGGVAFIAIRSREMFWFLAALSVAAQQAVEREERKEMARR